MAMTSRAKMMNRFRSSVLNNSAYSLLSIVTASRMGWRLRLIVVSSWLVSVISLSEAAV